MSVTTIAPQPPRHAEERPPTPARRPRDRWWHAAAVGAAVNLPGTLTRPGGDDRAFYASLPTPRLAPPGWLFGPVWAVNTR